MERSLPGLTVPGRAPQTVTSALEALIAERETPGLQFAHLDALGVRFSKQLGTANLERSQPVTASTLFHGYSVTKTFTAAAIVKLAEDGQLELDAPVSHYLPELRDGRATLRQILNHTAGYPNPIPLRWSHLPREHATFDERAFFARVIATHGGLQRTPGEKFAYSNVGYLVLGEVVRRVSGQRYSRYVEEALINPLGLFGREKLRFSFGAPVEHARGYLARWSLLNLALGLFLDRKRTLGGTREGWTAFADSQVDGDAYGGLMGNAAGFARYLQALLRREPPFTSEMVRQLFTPGQNAKGGMLPVSLAWFRGTLEGEAYFNHAGGGGGFYCELRVYPQLGRASVLLLNRTGIRNEHLLNRIDPLLLAT